MKRAAEVKRSVRRSEEPVAGDGCTAISGTMRGVGVTKKRPRKADKPSKKEKRSEEKKQKRSKKKKKRELEKQAAGDGFINIKKKKRTKKPTKGDEVTREMEGDNAAGGMTKLSQELLDYLRTKEVMGLLATEAPLLPWASKMGGALFESNQRLKEEIAAEFQENREFDAHVLYQYRTFGYAYGEIIKDYGYAYDEIIKETGTEEKSNKKKKLVTHEINQAEMGHYLSNEVWSYVMSIVVVHTFERAVIMEIESCRDSSTEARRLDNRKRHIENQANLLRQYRTNGHAALQYQVTDDEKDV